MRKLDMLADCRVSRKHRSCTQSASLRVCKIAHLRLSLRWLTGGCDDSHHFNDCWTLGGATWAPKGGGAALGRRKSAMDVGGGQPKGSLPVLGMLAMLRERFYLRSGVLTLCKSICQEHMYCSLTALDLCEKNDSTSAHL